ncbi:hypothetical protein [Amorphus sp. 3PC139-8]|uniref:hypothetical protein n=1 Tax=Amorphus sp. 3PC139-8 TaxID=2735676 RepID=UPI00345C7C97
MTAALSPHYAKAVRSLILAADRRLGGTPLSANELANQLALRGPWLSESSLTRDRRALRLWLDAAADNPATAIDVLVAALPAGFDDAHRLLDPALPIPIEELEAARATLSQKTSEIANLGRHLMEEYLEPLLTDDPTADPNSLVETVAGFARPAQLIHFGRTAGGRYVPLNAEILERISRYLDPARDNIELLRSVATHQPNRPALAALLFRASWYTGLRPYEWWHSTLLVDRRGQHTDAESFVIAALEARHATSFAQSTRDPAEIIAAHSTATATAPILHVINAKQTNANPIIAARERTLRLEAVPIPALRDIYFATQLRHFWAHYATEYDVLLAALTRYINRAHSTLYPTAGAVSLYTPRHDFIERAKLRYTRPEVAALAGHTGQRSPSHYGNRYTRQTTVGAERHAWLPKPDPLRTEQIHLLWNDRGRPGHYPPGPR